MFVALGARDLWDRTVPLAAIMTVTADSESAPLLPPREPDVYDRFSVSRKRIILGVMALTGLFPRTPHFLSPQLIDKVGEVHCTH